MAIRRYAAFLRGVMPTNLKMPALKRSLEAAAFTEVRTVLSSGNAVFSARPAAEALIQRKAEAAMTDELGRSFLTMVRSLDALRALVDADPFAEFRLAAGSKRVVTFLRDPPRAALALPIELDGARVLCLRGSELYSAYVPSPKGPVFMTLIQKTLGEALTTRTWDTVKKVLGDYPNAAASPAPARPRPSRS
ncbi:MAG TPA: DUF1697 domain-containing protein [Kofleriaceae bacterium]|nr:DUF1697 domain-containing protein [Kofleriaceae bacterium]HMG57277.1 DUF1697 domain-containing protein [Kofleriaceae bacterium]